MIVADRIDQINRLLPVVQSSAWAEYLTERAAELTEKLIGQDNEQMRGAIKELRRLIDLPAALQYERDHLTAELPETDSAL